MTIYVDKPIHAFGRMMMCHMIGTSLEELHEMAERIGLKREWFQAAPEMAVLPHYDICKAKRAQAIASGAVEIDRRTLGRIIRHYKATRQIPVLMLLHGGET